MKKYDFNVERMENCIRIDATNWLDNLSNILQTYRISGKKPVNYLTEVLDVNIKNVSLKSCVKSGDIVLLTRRVSDYSQHKMYALEGKKKYFNVPVMQIIGVFEDKIISYRNLSLLFDKILIKKIKVKNNLLETPDDNTMVGEVVKVGTCRFTKDWNPYALTVKVGDTVLIRDNVSTRVVLDNEEYFATEESMVVGIFNNKNNLALDNLKIINKSVLTKPYKAEKLLGSSSILLTPTMDYDNLDYSDIDNRDLFKIHYLDKSLTDLDKDDIILIDRNVTNYVYFKGDKYFITNGMDFIEAKVIEE